MEGAGPRGVGSDRTHLGSGSTAAQRRRAGRPGLEPADTRRLKHSQGPALATIRKVTSALSALGAAGATRSLRRAGCRAEQATPPAEKAR